MSTKIPNFEHSEHWMSKHRTFMNITFWPKTELWTCRTSQKTKQFMNIELFIPRLILSNQIFWKKSKVSIWVAICKWAQNNLRQGKYLNKCSKFFTSLKISIVHYSKFQGIFVVIVRYYVGTYLVLVLGIPISFDLHFNILNIVSVQK